MRESTALAALGLLIVALLVTFFFAPYVDTDHYRAEDGSVFAVICDKDSWTSERYCWVSP